MNSYIDGVWVAEGKPISSQNARKHGLNKLPLEDLVTLWFNTILNNEGDALEEPNAWEPRREAALRLAIAEACYHRALHKIESHDAEPKSAQRIANTLYAEVRLAMDAMPKRVYDGPADPFDMEFSEFGLKQLSKLLVEVDCDRPARTGAILAQRKKALRPRCIFD